VTTAARATGMTHTPEAHRRGAANRGRSHAGAKMFQQTEGHGHEAGEEEVRAASSLLGDDRHVVVWIGPTNGKVQEQCRVPSYSKVQCTSASVWILGDT
jgi:hypothetical protein